MASGTKFFFGLMIIFLAAMLLLISVFYQQLPFERNLNLITQPVVTGYTTVMGAVGLNELVNNKTDDKDNDEPNPSPSNPPQGNPTEPTPSEPPARVTCNAVAPSEDSIILRMDDAGANRYRGTIEKLSQDVLDKNMAISFAVIPDSLDKDEAFTTWMKSIKDGPNVELAQHGNHHDGAEFQNMGYDEAYGEIKEGKEAMIKYLDATPLTFIPPENEYNQDTVGALAAHDFAIISARDSEYEVNQEGVSHFGADVGTYDFPNKRMIPVEGVIAKCQSALDQKNLCVITLHPQDYTYDDDRSKIDPEKYAEFTRLLGELENMNASFKNFKDLVQCN